MISSILGYVYILIAGISAVSFLFDAYYYPNFVSRHIILNPPILQIVTLIAFALVIVVIGVNEKRINPPAVRTSRKILLMCSGLFLIVGVLSQLTIQHMHQLVLAYGYKEVVYTKFYHLNFDLFSEFSWYVSLQSVLFVVLFLAQVGWSKILLNCKKSWSNGSHLRSRFLAKMGSVVVIKLSSVTSKNVDKLFVTVSAMLSIVLPLAVIMGRVNIDWGNILFQFGTSLTYIVSILILFYAVFRRTIPHLDNKYFSLFLVMALTTVATFIFIAFGKAGLVTAAIAAVVLFSVLTI